MVFAYFSPETTLPLASVLSAVVGFLVLAGKTPFRVARVLWGRIAGPPNAAEAPASPAEQASKPSP